MKRRTVTVFSLSFIDCITCGLGAIILLFVIINTRSVAYRNTVTRELRAEADLWERKVLEGQKELVSARNTMDETEKQLVETQGLSSVLIRTLEEKKEQIAAFEEDTLASKQHINKLKADIRSAEEDTKRLSAGAKREDDGGSKLRRYKGDGDRQYLTDLKMGGKHILVLVDASASMLDDTIVGIIRRRNMEDAAKLTARKWQHVVSSVDWLMTQIPAESKFQVYIFNDDARPLIAGESGRWLEAGNPENLNRVVAELRRMVPENGTHLAGAFSVARGMVPRPDTIFLLLSLIHI